MSVISAEPNLPLVREYELKFTLSNARSAAVAGWLRTFCQPHPEYPEATISSVYYDTADWRLLNDKVHSDFAKTKVRLRWYEGSPSPAFIEAKAKRGAQREKLRLPLPPGEEPWTAIPLHDARFLAPLERLRREGMPEVERLTPAFQITYRRQRFLHTFSGCVFCLDAEICSPRVNFTRFRYSRSGSLATAVLEQKGHLDRLDPVVAGLERYGIRKGAFSKYLSCFLHLTDNFL